MSLGSWALADKFTSKQKEVYSSQISCWSYGHEKQCRAGPKGLEYRKEKNILSLKEPGLWTHTGLEGELKKEGLLGIKNIYVKCTLHNKNSVRCSAHIIPFNLQNNLGDSSNCTHFRDEKNWSSERLNDLHKMHSSKLRYPDSHPDLSDFNCCCSFHFHQDATLRIPFTRVSCRLLR